MVYVVILLLNVIPGVSGQAQAADTSQGKLRVPGSTTGVQQPTEACCRVARIDTTTGVVTARETATGYTFRFRVTNRRLLRSIKVADKVWADFVMRSVKVSAADTSWCCAILAAPPGGRSSDSFPSPGVRRTGCCH